MNSWTPDMTPVEREALIKAVVVELLQENKEPTEDEIRSALKKKYPEWSLGKEDKAAIAKALQKRAQELVEQASREAQSAQPSSQQSPASVVDHLRLLRDLIRQYGKPQLKEMIDLLEGD